MTSDLIGRRRAVEQRLDRVRALEMLLKEKIEILAQTTGLTIEQLDFDGSFRASLAALTAVASRRTRYDVVITLPDAPFAVRIQHLNSAVSVDVVLRRDGPYQSTPVPDGWGAPRQRAEPGAIPADSVQVVADLAELLWQGVDDLP